MYILPALYHCLVQSSEEMIIISKKKFISHPYKTAKIIYKLIPSLIRRFNVFFFGELLQFFEQRKTEGFFVKGTYPIFWKLFYL